MEGFQKPEETATFIEHIKAGLRRLDENEDSLLFFSGYGVMFPTTTALKSIADILRGPTKRDRTQLSEAQSYFVSTALLS